MQGDDSKERCCVNERTDLVSLRGRCQIVCAVFGGSVTDPTNFATNFNLNVELYTHPWGICRTRSHADSILCLLVYDI